MWVCVCGTREGKAPDDVYRESKEQVLLIACGAHDADNTKLTGSRDIKYSGTSRSYSRKRVARGSELSRPRDSLYISFLLLLSIRGP